MDGAKLRKRPKATVFFVCHPNATQARILRGTSAELFNDGLARLPRVAWVGYGAKRIGSNMEVGAMRSKIVSLLAVTFSLGFAQAASGRRYAGEGSPDGAAAGRL
jgi:hypothetical protein